LRTDSEDLLYGINQRSCKTQLNELGKGLIASLKIQFVCLKMDPQKQQIQSAQQSNPLVFKYIIIGPTGVGTFTWLRFVVSALFFF
jgi:hypothetical protein